MTYGKSTRPFVTFTGAQLYAFWFTVNVFILNFVTFSNAALYKRLSNLLKNARAAISFQAHCFQCVNHITEDLAILAQLA